jgi:putative ABC transport system ATP-binding protein
MLSSTALKMAVACRNLTKEFGDGDEKVMALRGVNVDVPPDEMTLLVGPSGCGKTTLISILAGLLDPTSGALQVLGSDLIKMSDRKKVNFRAKNIGFVFQQYNLLPALTAAENVAVPLLIAGQRRKQAVQQARDLLAKVGLAERTESLPTQLSGGQQQRVAIARALIHQPKLLVCDEPTAALDAHSGQIVMELLREVALGEDRAVIVVSHDNRVYKFGDRIIYMSDGLIEKVESNPAA